MGSSINSFTPVEDSSQVFQGECDFYIEYLYLQYTHPLYYIMIQSTTDSVGISYESS